MDNFNKNIFHCQHQIDPMSLCSATCEGDRHRERILFSAFLCSRYNANLADNISPQTMDIRSR